MNRRRWIVAGCFGVLVGVLTGGATWYWQVYHQPAQLTCRIEQSIVIRNQTENTVAPVSLYIKLPVTNERQKIGDIKVTPERYPVAREGNLLTLTGLDPMNPANTLKVVYAFTLKVRRTDAWRTREVMPADTEPEPDIESDDPMIVAKAREFCAADDSPEEKAYAFYKFAADAIHSKNELAPDFDRSAVGSLKSGEGVCGHKANLVTALCRASGIPARSVSGLTLPRRSKSGFGALGSHGWNEIYIEGKGWLFADPTYGCSALRRARYWDDYDIYRATVVVTGSNPIIFRDVKDRLPADCVPYCEMTGFPCFLLTFKKGPDLKAVWIRGDEMNTKVTYVDEAW